MMEPAFLASGAPQLAFIGLLAFLAWLLIAALTIVATIVAAWACRSQAVRPDFARRSLLTAFKLAAALAAALLTQLAFVAVDSYFSPHVEMGNEFGFFMFQGAVTALLWGVLFLLRRKLLGPPAPSPRSDG